MPACPWCKAAVGDLLAPCPRCGRTSDEQAAPRPISGGVAGLVPDLDLPARPSKATAAAKAVAPTAAAPAPRASVAEEANNAFADPGARTFEDDGDLSGGSLDLDLGSGPPLIAPAPAAQSAPADPGAPSRAGSVTTSGGPGGPGGTPSASTASAASAASATALARTSGPPGGRVRVEIDPVEARALADYGDAPDAGWRAPIYAYRVLRRRPDLKKAADLKRREAERAQGAADDALLQFAEVVRGDAERLGAYSDALQAVRATEDVLGRRDAVLAAETDAHKQRQAELNAKLAELEVQLGQIQAEERGVAGELAEADTLLKRAEARAKRVEIEMRNAIAQAEGTGQAGQAGEGPGA